MKGLNAITIILLIIGGINWGLVGLTNGFNLIATVFAFAPIITTIIYVLVGLSAIYQIMPLSKQLQGGMA